MESTFTLFKVRGIPIGINWSWLLMFAVFVWSLAQQLFPDTYHDLSTTTYFVMAVVAVLIFFGSLLLHELGHAFQALREGMQIDGITLWVFGGVARFKGSFPSAGAEFRIALAGPIVTAILAPLFFALTAIGNAVSAPTPVIGVVDYLARINLTLLLFNLVPALPLDGGRVLRSILWYRRGDYTSATLSAARGGRLFGFGLMAFGAIALFTNADFGGFLYVLIGMFLVQAAQGEVSFAEFKASAGDLRVRDVMSPVDEATAAPRDALTIDPDAELTDAAAALHEKGSGYVVSEGRTIGIITIADIARAIRSGPAPATPAVASPRRRRIGWIIAILAGLAAIGYLYAPPMVVFQPGAAFDVVRDIKITGVPTTKVDGEIVLTSVGVTQPNGFGLLAAVLQGREIAPISNLIPRGVDPDEYFEEQKALFAETQRIATAAAAREAGLDVELTGGGAVVDRVIPGAPAAKLMEEGDVVTAIDGDAVEVAGDLGRAIRRRPEGTLFDLTVERGGRERSIEIRSREGVAGTAPGIGIELTTKDFDVSFPFKITFRERDIGGPSAGLAYALAVYDLLDATDVAQGRTVATSGTIELDGQVGPVGGLDQKVVSAERSGSDLFLVPDDEVAEARSSSLDVIGVTSLEDAIRALT